MKLQDTYKVEHEMTVGDTDVKLIVEFEFEPADLDVGILNDEVKVVCVTNAATGDEMDESILQDAELIFYESPAYERLIEGGGID